MSRGAKPCGLRAGDERATYALRRLAQVIDDEHQGAARGVCSAQQFAGRQRRVRRDRACDRGSKRLLAHLGSKPDWDVPGPGELAGAVTPPPRLPAPRPATQQHCPPRCGEIGDLRTRRRLTVNMHPCRHEWRQIRVLLEEEAEVRVHGGGAGMTYQRLRRVLLLAVQVEVAAQRVPVLIGPGQGRAGLLQTLQQLVVADHRDMRAAPHTRPHGERRVRADESVDVAVELPGARRGHAGGCPECLHLIAKRVGGVERLHKGLRHSSTRLLPTRTVHGPFVGPSMTGPGKTFWSSWTARWSVTTTKSICRSSRPARKLAKMRAVTPSLSRSCRRRARNSRSLATGMGLPR